MSDPNRSYEIIQQEVLNGSAAPGSILAKVMADLSPADLQALKMKAIEGKLGLELQSLQMQLKLQASNEELRIFVDRIKDLEWQNRGKPGITTGNVSVEGPTGRTTITTTKAGCLLFLTAIATGLFVLVLVAFNILRP